MPNLLGKFAYINGQNNQIIDEEDNRKYSFEDDLWDSLNSISLNFRRGNQFLNGFSNFCKSYNKTLQTFSYGLQKCSEQFEKDMLQNKIFDTTSIAITNIKQGIEEISHKVSQKVTIIYNDLIEPLEVYQKNYVQTSTELISQAKTYWHTLEDEKKKLSLIKERYCKLMSDVEQSEIQIEVALLQHEKGVITLEQVQKITNSTLNVKYKAELASQEYKKEVEYVNLQLSKFGVEYKPMLSKLQQGEESRINFLKYSFEKFLKHQSLLGKIVLDKSTEIQSSVQMINSETDLKIFIDENKTYQQFESRVDFQVFEHSRDVQQQKAELIDQINQQKQQNTISQIEKDLKLNELEEHILLEYLNRIMRGNDLSFDEKSEIISSLHNPTIRDVDENYKVVWSILHSSQQIFTIKEIDGKERQKIYLTQYLSDHGIWQEQQVWKQCIHKIINQKFHEAIQSPAAINSKQIQQHNQPNTLSSGSLLGQLGKLKGFWGQGKSDDKDQSDKDKSLQKPLRIPKNLAQNIIFNSLSKFLYHFVNFQLSFESSKEVLLAFCNKYELDQNRTHLLLSELESIQKKTRFSINSKDILEISRLKKSHRFEKFGEGIYLILQFVVKYIDNDKELSNVILLNKQCKQKLTTVVFKQALLFSQPERLRAKRLPIWEAILKIKENQRDYFAFRDKVINNNEIISNVEEVIIMDVQRSFTKTKQIDPVVLTNILKTYAFFNPEIEYCQGMNFVAGFLFLVLKDEVKAFKALQQIVEAHDMAELFNTELPKLKLFFYQFDRLLNIILPQVHNHFKNQEGDNLSERLMQLWDYFLTCGWKAIFKMGLSVLKNNQADLCRMNFEQILNFITEKPKTILSEHISLDDQRPILYQELKTCLKDTPKLDFILTKLEREFKDSLEAANLPKQGNFGFSPQKQQNNSNSQQRQKEEDKIQEL
ncbi:tbc domain-containing protein [Stylonychia lemnae]|uniref:Tbc domain-containing protein n=1 Tax=Stylonychia lemnae TaxID=5949 RepID=A0A078A3P9_STYLE|nr:tbc domain-containing protein [Stylonychia lemnae]|eukprot:CDW76802.1 tbc domain-containing protein [Stylonychia lemnae]